MLLLMIKLMTDVELSSQSTVTGVTVQNIHWRGQSSRQQSLLMRKGKPQGYFFYTPTPAEREKRAEGTYPGAIVVHCETGYYEKPVIVLDFNSLYPNVMMAFNLCYTTQITPEEIARRGFIEGVDYFRLPDVGLEADGITVKLTPNLANPCFVTVKHRTGLAPQILAEVVAKRKAAKKESETYGDPAALLKPILATAKADLEAATAKGLATQELRDQVSRLETEYTTLMNKFYFYDNLQLAFKTTANSLYGYFGLVCKAVALSVTAIGRWMILSAKHFVETNYTTASFPELVQDCRVIYGDTDSVFVLTVTHDNLTETAFRIGLHMEEHIAVIFRKPNRMELEKILRPAILKGPKKYASVHNTLTNKDTIKDRQRDPIKFSRKQITKGDESVRRDACLMVSNMVGRCQGLLLGDGTDRVEDAKSHAKKCITNLLMDRVDYFQLILSRQLKTEPENYKSKNPPIHVFLAQKLAKRDPALAPVPGDRIPFVLIRINEKTTNKSKAGEDPVYAWNQGLPVDTDAYLWGQVVNPLTRLFAPVLAPGIMVEKVPKKGAIADKIRSAMAAENKRRLGRIWAAVEPHLFRGRHMTHKRIEVGQAAFVFAVRPTCVQCKRTLPPELQGAALCAPCTPLYMPQRLVENLEALQAAQDSYVSFWSTCQSCMGVKFSQPITCPNFDCHVYWERRASEREVKRCQTMRIRLDVNVSKSEGEGGELF